jgi:hypothetical protein
MGGERFFNLLLSPVADVDQKTQTLYAEVLADKILPLLQERKVKYELQPGQVMIANTDDNFKPSYLPMELKDWSKFGWQDLRYGSLIDPNKDLIQVISKILFEHLPAGTLRESSMDQARPDLSWSDVGGPEDLTACSNECGYCGQCDY